MLKHSKIVSNDAVARNLMHTVASAYEKLSPPEFFNSLLIAFGHDKQLIISQLLERTPEAIISESHVYEPLRAWRELQARRSARRELGGPAINKAHYNEQTGEYE